METGKGSVVGTSNVDNCKTVATTSMYPSGNVNNIVRNPITANQ